MIGTPPPNPWEARLRIRKATEAEAHLSRGEMEACRRTMAAATAPHPADLMIDALSAQIEQTCGLSEENGKLLDSSWPGTR